MIRQVLLFAVLLAIPSTRAQAQALTPPVHLSLEAPDQLDLDAGMGSRGAEYGAAILGEALLIGASGVAFISGLQDDARLDSHARAMLVQTARPVVLGGLVSRFGARSGGRGRSGIAMLGATPGTALVIAGLWMLPADDVPRGASISVWMLGHATSVIGAVAAYRHSGARRTHRADLTPSAFVDRDAAGLALTGRF